MWSEEAMSFLLKNKKFETVLDVGSGGGEHKRLFEENGKKVTCVDLGKSAYYLGSDNYNNDKIISGDFNNINIEENFDLVWCSHVLEHQKNINLFLEKSYDLVSENGLFCVTVPPMKNMLVGGHLSLWNLGLLFYNLVSSGIDCSDAHGKKYGYNISVIVHKKEKIKLEELDLSYDVGDLEKLQNYFPWKIKQGDNGEFNSINWV